ncbi:type II toxin-antitoxin system RelE/ParE family toxin [Escherichia coli]|uniref:type II toxin-antitoxin system RelE/ParE family toxin n=1 Tax=Escherichia coli TaxID=562 RepID=UPI0028AD7A41|nr:type II toxin-antitoxin system RelE/ParE family toxin [Escherichia coli]
MEIFWTMLASQDRKRIRKYIAEQNLMAAIELDERIGYSASSLVNATMFDRYLPFSCPLNTFVTDAVRFAPFHHH